MNDEPRGADQDRAADDDAPRPDPVTPDPATPDPGSPDPAQPVPARPVPPQPAPPVAGASRRTRLRTRLWVLTVAGLAVPAAMTLGGLALAWLLRREPLWLALTQAQPWGAVLLWSALGMAISLGSTAGLAMVWPQFARALEESGLQAGEDVLRVTGLPVMALVVAVAGLGEEFLFRGGLQPSIGVVPAAVAFGMAHGIWNPRELWAYVLSAALAGVAFGAIYAHTGLLWSAVLAHAGHNLVVTFYLVHRRRSAAGADRTPEPPPAKEPFSLDDGPPSA